MQGHAVSACLSLGKTATLFSRGAVACCILTNGMYEIPTAPHSCILVGCQDLLQPFQQVYIGMTMPHSSPFYQHFYQTLNYVQSNLLLFYILTTNKMECLPYVH